MPKTKNSGFPTDLSSLPKFGAGGRPPRNRSRAPVFKTGPRILQLGKKPRKAETQIWTVPPAGFLTAHNSVDEWQLYLALAMHLDDPPNPFKPPFVGGNTKWVYQKAESPTGAGLGGIGRVPAGSVTDYAVAEGGGWLVLRLDTERFHIFASPAIQEKDNDIRINLRGVTDVVTIYSSDYIWDTTGQTVMKVSALALKHIEYPSPTGVRPAIRVRRPR